MKKLCFLLSVALVVSNKESKAQNISGIINHYAAVKNISGSGISVSTATAFNTGDRVLLIQMKGASVDQNNTSNFGDLNSLGGAGTYEFLTVASVSGSVITLSSSPQQSYNFATGSTQLVRVPKYCTPTVSSTLTCAAWNPTTGLGGIIALEANTLTLNADIDASEKGFRGGNFGVGTYSCDNGNFAAPANSFQGGKKGENIAAYISGLDGLKGKQANGGGASNSGNSGAGGGGNGGAGGFGGNQYTDCDPNVDDRGIGGLNLAAGFSKLFFGGGGGGGFQDNQFSVSSGGNGGGIIYIRANVIVANNRTIRSNGGDVTIIANAEGSGGGGAGGTIFLECPNVTGSLSVKANGGQGGSNNNQIFVMNCHGPGGGGGGGVFAFSYPNLPSNITYNCDGGDAGTVQNSTSTCFGTSYGATDGAAGDTLAALPSSPISLNASNAVTIAGGDVHICRGGTATLTASGPTYLSWSSGASGTLGLLSPTITTVYTIFGSDGDNFCQSAASTSVIVDPCYESVSELSGLIDFIVYPNPVSDNLFVKTGFNAKISIGDQTGRIVVERNVFPGEHKLDLGNLATGVYFLTVSGNEGSKTLKLLKSD